LNNSYQNDIESKIRKYQSTDEFDNLMKGLKSSICKNPKKGSLKKENYKLNHLLNNVNLSKMKNNLNKNDSFSKIFPKQVINYIRRSNSDERYNNSYIPENINVENKLKTKLSTEIKINYGSNILFT